MLFTYQSYAFNVTLSFKKKISCPLIKIGQLLTVKSSNLKLQKHIEKLDILPGLIVNQKTNKLRLLRALQILFKGEHFSFKGSVKIVLKNCFVAKKILLKQIQDKLKAQYPNYNFLRLSKFIKMPRFDDFDIKPTQWADTVLVKISYLKQKQVIWYRLKGKQFCYKLINTVAKNLPVRKSMLNFQSCQLSRTNYLIVNFNKLHLANKRLLKNHFLIDGDLIEQPLVRQGAKLKMLVNEMGVSLIIPVLAQENAQKGELLQVKDLNNQFYIMKLSDQKHGVLKEMIHDH